MIRTTSMFMICLGLAWSHVLGQIPGKELAVFQPRTEEEADTKAKEVLSRMTLDEKLAYVGGDKSFFIRALPR